MSFEIVLQAHEMIIAEDISGTYFHVVRIDFYFMTLSYYRNACLIRCNIDPETDWRYRISVHALTPYIKLSTAILLLAFKSAEY